MAQPEVRRSAARWRSPTVVAVGIVGLLVVSFLASNVGATGVVPTGTPAHPATAPLAAPSARASPTSPTVRPQSTLHTNGTFLTTNSTFANLPTADDPCGHGNSSFYYPPYFSINETFQNCFGGSQEPSLLPLANGTLGVAYSTETTGHTDCSANASEVVSRVAFQISKDGGHTFGPADWLGNETCAYINAIEPSFAVSSTGKVYGVFVQTANTSTSVIGNITLPTGLGNRTNDSLGFVTSTDNGTSFSPVVSLGVAGWSQIAVPRIATIGRTVYIVYDELNNLSGITLPSSYPYFDHPIAVDLIYSSNGGATWHGPYGLPGLNGTQGWTAFAPSIAVNSAGKVAVSYDTNRSCIVLYPAFGFFCSIYSDQVVVATSTSNGTSWSAPVAVSGQVGENGCAGYYNDTGPNYWYACYAYLFQSVPQSSVAWSPSHPSDLYVAWDGTYVWWDSGIPEEGYSGLWSAASTNGGASWTNATVSAPEYNGTVNENYDYNPTLLVHGGTVYLAYAADNWTYCYGTDCSPFAWDFSFWMTTSSNGLSWAPSSLLAVDHTPFYETYGAWSGYTEALAYESQGPVVAFSQPTGTQTYFEPPPVVTGTMYWYTEFINSTADADLTVAAPSTAPTTTVTFTEQGLPANASWGFDLGSLAVTTNATSVVVGNVPLNATLLLLPLSATVTGLYWTEYAPVNPAGYSVSFSGPTVEYVNYTALYGIELYVHPSTLPYFFIYFDMDGSFYEYYYFTGFPMAYAYPSFPWYFPAGTVLSLGQDSIQAAAPVSYFSGTGNGSSTVFGNETTITVNGPINETLWFGAFGNYQLTFVPVGLPSTSVYQFSFDGTVYSAPGTTNVTVPNVVTGAYTVADVQANASTAGWEYFGTPSTGATVVVPAEPIIVLNFSYAEVDLGAPAGPITFHANGLAPGDEWSLTFNGTSYSASTPWLNVTAHPGRYAVAAAPVAASANDTTAYAATGFGPTLSVTTNTVYSINYTSAFRVEVYGGAGGAVTGGGTHWLAAGTQATYSATAHTDYGFVGWVGSGPGSYTGPDPNATVTVGGPITEAASFVALPNDRFNLTFTMAGLPSGTWWTVDVDGTGYSSDQSTLTVPDLNPCGSGAAGLYSIAVPYVYPNGTSGVRYIPGSYATQVCTTGTTVVSLTFSAEYLVTPLASPGGDASVVVNTIASHSPTWVPAGGTAGLEQSADDGYVFSGWVGTGDGNYTGPSTSYELTPRGPVTETAEFQPIVVPPPLTDTLFVHMTSNLNGTAWSLDLNGVGYSATGAYLNVTGLTNGTYTLAVPSVDASNRLTQYSPVSVPSSLDLTGNYSLTLSYGTSYWVSESATAGGTVNGPTNGFVASGKSISLNATPNAGYEFVGWAGTGASSYTGTTSLTSVVVNGPITEVASFAPIPAATSSSSSNPLSSPGAIAGLAIAGLVIGLVVGFVVFRRRSPPPGDAPGSEGSA